ncbi:hypothetical protein [Luedemannella flava]|uniref:hypothetical protein n=1 Tax=Luedemannella flava TaxID=349316 RepID=UPI0031D0532D
MGHAAHVRWVVRLFVVGGALVVAYLALASGDSPAHADDGLLGGAVDVVSEVTAPVAEAAGKVSDIVETAAPVDDTDASGDRDVPFDSVPDAAATTVRDRGVNDTAARGARPAGAARSGSRADAARGVADVVRSVPRTGRAASKAAPQVVAGAAVMVPEVVAGAAVVVPRVVAGAVATPVAVVVDHAGDTVACLASCLTNLVEPWVTAVTVSPAGGAASGITSATEAGGVPAPPSAARPESPPLAVTAPQVTTESGAALARDGLVRDGLARHGNARFGSSPAGGRGPVRPWPGDPTAPTGPDAGSVASSGSGAGGRHAGPDAAANPVWAPPPGGGISVPAGDAPLVGRRPRARLLPG